MSRIFGDSAKKTAVYQYISRKTQNYSLKVNDTDIKIKVKKKFEMDPLNYALQVAHSHKRKELKKYMHNVYKFAHKLINENPTDKEIKKWERKISRNIGKISRLCTPLNKKWDETIYETYWDDKYDDLLDIDDWVGIKTLTANRLTRFGFNIPNV